MKALHTAIRGLRWALLVIAMAVMALFVAWHALAAVDFGYSAWYDLLAIDETIETHGPENTTRPGFQHTDRAERERVFGAIVDAVHDDGRGLGGLVYRDADGRILGPLLTEDEIIHLQDVAHLVNVFSRAGWLAAGLVVVLAGTAAVRREVPPDGRRMALVSGVTLACLALAVLVVGPERVFYWFHVLVFPPENEWFFNYQDSLMSMMMQAPNLFAPITVALVLLAAIVGGVVWLGLARALRWRAAR